MFLIDTVELTEAYHTKNNTTGELIYYANITSLEPEVCCELAAITTWHVTDEGLECNLAPRDALLVQVRQLLQEVHDRNGDTFAVQVVKKNKQPLSTISCLSEAERILKENS